MMERTDAYDPLRTTDHTPDATPRQIAGGEVGGPRVPGYEIEGVLGRGGMGVVYRARHLALKRNVALKMVLAGGHAGQQELGRFRLEAEAVARLQHPNIVQIHEVGESDGRPYCALELVEGGNLTGKLAGKPLPAREAAHLVETLARAVQLAHSRNVVHRDLKPANVLLGTDGTPKITDFGLARMLDSDSGETRAGAIMGTPSYMAPEQASGQTRDAGPAADVYALGAILYECLSGRPPFRGDTVLETLEQVRTQEPTPPSRWHSGVSLDLDTICLKCLRKEPEQRYASAAELADDLARYSRGEPIQARPVGQLERCVKLVKRNPVLTAVGLVAVVALVAGTTVSTMKYLDAEYQKGVAEERREDAEKQKTIAEEKRQDAEYQKGVAEDRRKDAETQKGIAQEKEQEARREADKARKARDFLASILRLSETDVQGGNVTARQILANAEQRIPIEFAEQPELRAELVEVIGQVKRGIARRTPRAMLLEVSGNVQVKAASGAERPFFPHMLLNIDDQLTLAPGARAQLVFLSDLHKEWIESGTATIDADSCKPASAIKKREEGPLLNFVRMPQGSFFMGGGKLPGGIVGKGVRTVIQNDFEIAVHPVTQGQWQAIMGDNPSCFSRGGTSREVVKDISDEELKLFPVENVSWDQAQFFIKKLNEKERGRGYFYRLPTEAEWEYACRGGATTEQECSFSFYLQRPTNDLSSLFANFNGNLPVGNGPKGKYLQRPSRVGAYLPNKLGLCDMHGNVWQYCSDPLTPGSPVRVNRGGCWSGEGIWCAAGFRGGLPQTDYDYSRGFRLVRVR